MEKEPRKLIVTGYYIALVVLVLCDLAGICSIGVAVVLALSGASLIYVHDKKKRIKAFMAIGVLLVVSSLALGWPVRYALPIEGQVTDKVTGEPIENAIFEVAWWASYSSGGKEVDKTFAVAGKDGKYRIPGRLSLPSDLGDFGLRRAVTLRHPLYEIVKFRDMGTIITLPDEKTATRVRPHITRTRRDFKLQKLEDKYKTNSIAKDRTDLQSSVDFNMPDYCSQARKLQLVIDCVKYFPVWDKIGAPYGIQFRLAKERITGEH